LLENLIADYLQTAIRRATSGKTAALSIARTDRLDF
jgi:hypothetical protein